MNAARPLVDALESQLRAHPTRTPVAVRIHPADWERMVDEYLTPAGWSVKDMPADTRASLTGLPVVEDLTAMDGPVVEWLDS